MAQGYTQERVDLERQFAKQIGFLKRSAESYDNGFHDEAIRLAVVVRVLVHDTPKSISLLTQLCEKDRYYWDSRAAIDKKLFPESDSCFVLVQADESGAKYLPVLERGPIPMFQSDFDGWWNGVVFIDSNGRKVTRKDLILTASNQDGGAHVDPSLDPVYADLSRGGSFGWAEIIGTEKRSLQGAELAAVRQIAHELLKTLVPDYAPMIPPLTGACIGFTNPDIPGLKLQIATPKVRAELERKGSGRNELCHCGSGKKYKKCHGR